MPKMIRPVTFPANYSILTVYGGRCRIRTCNFHRVKVAILWKCRRRTLSLSFNVDRNQAKMVLGHDPLTLSDRLTLPGEHCYRSSQSNARIHELDGSENQATDLQVV